MNFINNVNQMFKGETVWTTVPLVRPDITRWGTYQQFTSADSWFDGDLFSIALIDGVDTDLLNLPISDTPGEFEIGSKAYWDTLGILQPYGHWSWMRVAELIGILRPQWTDVEIRFEGFQTLAILQVILKSDSKLVEVTYSMAGIQRAEQYLDEPLPVTPFGTDPFKWRLKMKIERQLRGIQTIPPHLLANNVQWGPQLTDFTEWETVAEIIKRPKKGQSTVPIKADDIINSINWNDRWIPIEEVFTKQNWNNYPFTTSNAISNKWGETCRVSLNWEYKEGMNWINYPLQNEFFTNWSRDFTLYPWRRMDRDEWIKTGDWMDIFPTFARHTGLTLYNIHAYNSGAARSAPGFTNSNLLQQVQGWVLYLYIAFLDFTDEIQLLVNGVPVTLVAGIDFAPTDDLSDILDSTFNFPSGTFQIEGVQGAIAYYCVRPSDVDRIISVTDRGNWGKTYKDEFGGWSARTAACLYNHSLVRYPRYTKRLKEITASHLFSILDGRYWAFPEFTDDWNSITRYRIYADTGRMLSEQIYEPVNPWEKNRYPIIHQEMVVLGGIGSDIRPTERRVFVTAAFKSKLYEFDPELEMWTQLPYMDEWILRDDILTSWVAFRNTVGGLECLPIVKCTWNRTQTQNDFRRVNDAPLTSGSVGFLNNWDENEVRQWEWDWLITIPMVNVEAGEWIRRGMQGVNSMILNNKGDLNLPLEQESFTEEIILLENCETQWDPIGLNIILKARSNG